MDKVIKRIEEMGADVVGYENCCGPREKKDPIDETKDPITAIAEKYLRVNCSVMSPNPGRLEALDAQIDEYKVDGVVEVLLQACHTFAIESDAIRTFVTKEKNFRILRSIQTILLVTRHRSIQDSGHLSKCSVKEIR